MQRKPVTLLPNLLTLANAFFGLLALSRAIDALTQSGQNPAVFYDKMDRACLFVFIAMICDSLDGLVARITKGESAFGAQLDSFSDALTFGVVPALLVKVLVEHEADWTAYAPSPRLNFLAAASFALMAILRLARFNLEPDPDTGAATSVDDVASKDDARAKTFRGLPSPGAAGAVVATIWFYLILRHPSLQTEEGTPIWLHRLFFFDSEVMAPVLEWVPALLACALPCLGFLMVSNVRYVHAISFLTRPRGQFFTLVGLVFTLILFSLAPVPFLFLFFWGFTLSGLLQPLIARLRAWKRLRFA